MPSETKLPAVQRYPLLRFIGVIYKFAALLVLIVTGSMAVMALAGVTRTQGLPLAVIGVGGAYLLSGGMTALSLYVVSRLIDLFLETNDNTRRMAELLQEQNRMLKQIYRRQANPYPRPADAIRERQQRLYDDGVFASPD